MSTFQSKKRLTSAEPRLVMERTVSRPGTVFTASSMGSRDRHLHLFDRHHAVVDADYDARKIRLGKNGDGYLEVQVDAGHGENDREEKDGARGPGQPEPLMGDGTPDSEAPGSWFGITCRPPCPCQRQAHLRRRPGRPSPWFLHPVRKRQS